MKTQQIECPLGLIIISEKESHREEGFTGDVRLQFYPKFPQKNNGAKLECFSIDYPGHNQYRQTDCYEWLLSWYKNGRLLEDN